MDILFALLWLATFIIMIIATIKPKYAILPFAKKSRLKAFITWFGMGFICMILFAVTMPDDTDGERVSQSKTSNIEASESQDKSTDETSEEDINEDEVLEVDDAEIVEETLDVSPEDSDVLQLEIRDQDDENLVGDIVLVGDMGLQVLGYQISSGEGFEEPSDGYEFIIVYVCLVNWGTDTAAYDSYDFQLSNSNGVLDYEAFVMFDSDTYLGGADLLPGGYVEGTIVFERPVGDQNVLLHYTPGLWGNASTVIQLGYVRDEYYLLKDIK